MNAKKLENDLRIFSSGDVQNTSNLEWLSARELVLHVSKTSPIFFTTQIGLIFFVYKIRLLNSPLFVSFYSVFRSCYSKSCVFGFS